MTSLQHVSFCVAIIAAMAVSPVAATEAGKLLPGDSKLILSLNLRQLLSDHKNTPFVQRYLDQWRLALKGDDEQLKNYYRLQELDKFEGISEQDFLIRARLIKNVCDALGMNPLEDIDQITFALHGKNPGHAIDAGSFILIVEGRFKLDKFQTALKPIAHVNPAGNVWQLVGSGRFVSLPDAQTLVVTSTAKAMDELLLRAAGKSNDGLPRGTRTALDSVRKEQAGIVVGDFDLLAEQTLHFLKEGVARSLAPDDAIRNFIVNHGAEWMQKYINEISTASIAISLAQTDARLQLGLDAKKPQAAKDLHAQIRHGNFLGGLALKAMIKNEVAQRLSNILLRQQASLSDTTVITHTEIPYDFVKLVAKGPWMVMLSKDFAPAGPEPMPTMTPSFLDSLLFRITSIPLWTLPARDKTKPLAPGTFEVVENLGVPYLNGQTDTVRHRLDMYLPKDKKDFPVLVLVHGGAWVIGDNRFCGLYSSVGQFFASQGIGVVMPNYRLSPSVKHPEHVKDVARAVAWTRANIGKFGGDAKQLYVAGHSAGGHLVTFLAADERYLGAVGMKAADIQGVIAISGVYNVPSGVMRFAVGGSGPRAMHLAQMLPLRGDSLPVINDPLPGVPAQLNLFARLSARRHANVPGLAAVPHPQRHAAHTAVRRRTRHADPGGQDRQFHQALDAQGCQSRLLTIAKRNHNSLMFSVIQPADPVAQAMLKFIRK